jgi:hypothetical protein
MSGNHRGKRKGTNLSVPHPSLTIPLHLIQFQTLPNRVQTSPNQGSVILVPSAIYNDHFESLKCLQPPYVLIRASVSRH